MKEEHTLVELIKYKTTIFLANIAELNETIKEMDQRIIPAEIIKESRTVETGVELIALIDTFLDQVIEEESKKRGIKEFKRYLESNRTDH